MWLCYNVLCVNISQSYSTRQQKQWRGHGTSKVKEVSQTHLQNYTKIEMFTLCLPHRFHNPLLGVIHSVRSSSAGAVGAPTWGAPVGRRHGLTRVLVVEGVEGYLWTDDFRNHRLSPHSEREQTEMRMVLEEGEEQEVEQRRPS